MNSYDLLKEIILANKFLNEFLIEISSLGIEDYYIGGGCIAQTVWNYLSKNDYMYGIDDIDFLFFDANDTYKEKEKSIKRSIDKILLGTDITINVRNEAFSHEWYKERFSQDIEPFKTLEEAIESFPTTATSIGVRYENGNIKIYAPYELEDLFNKIVRLNAKLLNRDLFYDKVNEWVKTWTDLVVIPWDII